MPQSYLDAARLTIFVLESEPQPDLSSLISKFDSILICGSKTCCFEVSCLMLILKHHWTVNTAVRYTHGVTKLFLSEKELTEINKRLVIFS
jgi:hypothetical protein